ncbi:3-oxoacyl-[acyl-carrier-protein] reductase FabG [Fonsecaea pedrosoi]|nr:3-oxoacyl-[acyl-carrier-protein] reductase FabG [Fonsecaea pedrosoi]
MAQKTLQGKVALVTGASSGMGRGIALGLANQGVAIICCDLKPEANPEGFEKDLQTTTVDVIRAQGGQAVFFKVDISVMSDIEKAFSEGIAKFGRLDIVVNCAGYWAPFRKFAVEDDDLWQKMANVNLLGTSKCNRLAIQQFLKQEVDEEWGSRGKIVNVSSCAGSIAFPYEVAYSATKAAINHMTRAGALDHAQDSININCIAPGVVATGMARKNFEDGDIIKHMKKATPWPRLGTVEDIAGTALFLCSKQSSWLTGQVFAVDGGMTLGVPP